MKTSPTGLALIKHFEGFSPGVYRCPAGYWTIGYGHLLRETNAQTIDETAAEQLLIADVAVAERAVTRLITRALLQNQFDALVSFAFNLGSGALQRSRLRQVVNRGEDGLAPAEFRRWSYAQGRRLAGLAARRATEARIYTGFQSFTQNP